MRLFKIKFPEYQNAAFFRHSPVPMSESVASSKI